MRVGVFDSGLGGLTVVNEINKVFKGADLFYIADTKFAPYGPKSQNDILNRCVEISDFLSEKHNIDVLIIACNTATSAAVKYLREKFPNLIVIGTEPGIKPAISLTKSSKVGVLATTATLKGDKYQNLVNDISTIKKVELFEEACSGLVEQIEDGKLNDSSTFAMLENWLMPMKQNSVDTIVLGCTHYPLVSNTIKKIMGSNINIIETGSAIAKRLIDLIQEKNHQNCGDLNISIYHTGKLNINMVNIILEDYKNASDIKIRECDI